MNCNIGRMYFFLICIFGYVQMAELTFCHWFVFRFISLFFIIIIFFIRSSFVDCVQVISLSDSLQISLLLLTKDDSTSNDEYIWIVNIFENKNVKSIIKYMPKIDGHVCSAECNINCSFMGFLGNHKT